MFSNANGNDNVALGWNSGRYFGTGTSAITDTSGSIFIGTLARANASGEVNQIVIGMNALGLGSNTIVLGNNNVTTTALKGFVGINTTTPTVRLEIDAADNGLQRALKIRNTDSGSFAAAAIDFKTTNNDVFSVVQLNDTLGSFVPGDVILTNQAVGANVIFGNVGTADRMIMSTNNNVGIGYAVGNVFSDKFNVLGTSGFAGTMYLNNGTYLYGYDSSNNEVLSYRGDSAPTMQLGFIDNTWYDMTLQNGYIEVLDNGVLTSAWANPTAQGTIITRAEAGEQIFPQQLLFLSSSGQWHKADADAAATSTSLLGICLTEAEANDDISVLLEGHYSTTTYHDQIATPASIGVPLYVSTNAGYVTETAPTGTGDIVRLIGHNIYGELGGRGPDWATIRFKPDNTWIEI